MAIQASTHPEVAKNQHLVPQTYMSAWSYNNGDSVWVYDKNNAKHPDKNGIPAVRSRSIEKINCINNYHDIKAGDFFTTEAALKVFDENELKETLRKGILAAEKRSKELSD